VTVLANYFFNFVTTNSYFQSVNFPTQGENTLNLVLAIANDEQVICSVLPNLPLGQ